MLGEHQRLSAVPGAVATSSVPLPPVRPREIGEASNSACIGLSTHGMEKEKRERPLTAHCIPSYSTSTYGGSQGHPS